MRSLPSIAIAALLIAAAANGPATADVRCGPTAATRVGVAPPPPLPETDQPPMPAYGYVWTPGSWYWNADVNDYYWSPGAWILPPAIGLFWTPGYWGWDDGGYLYHTGYWGSHVGFYGGVRYGFGYWGHGYDGGYWNGRTFYYNRAYNNVGGLHINALYNRRAPQDRGGSRISFNGGRGGIVATARDDERLAERDKHVGATSEQTRHAQSAAGDPGLRAGINHGHPLLAGGAVAAGHAAAARSVPTRSDANRADFRHSETAHAKPAHQAAGHVYSQHAVHPTPTYRREPMAQSHHFAPGYGHNAPARFAPGYREPPHMQSQPFRAAPQHGEAPHPGPAREGPPRGGEPGRPHH
jgi:hypothetical protein